MLTIETKDGQKINLSESDIRDIIRESIEEVRKITEARAAMDSFCKWKNKEIVFEGLIKTYPSKSVLNMIRKIAKGANIGAGVPSNKLGQEQIYITFNTGFEGNGELFSEIVHYMDTYGWYFAKVMGTDINKLDAKAFFKMVSIPSFTLIFEPKFDLLVDENTLPHYFYHITPSKNINKILKKGLIPKNHCKVNYHPERVYFFPNYPKNWKDIADGFRRDEGTTESYCLLSIDAEQLNKKNSIYVDQNSNNRLAFYTEEPIPPFVIEVIDEE